MLYGAIIGDMAGSIYEFNNIKHKPLRVLPREAFFTDDTVMTVAVAHALSQGLDIADTMRAWGDLFPHRGYGLMFSEWLRDPEAGPYYSYGNGSAMRVSAAGWLGHSLKEVQDLATRSAEVTHNHPEGIKGAVAVAQAIYLARTGHSKRQIRNYIMNKFGYDLRRTCDEIRPHYRFNETCQETVPEAIIAFLESRSFTDSIKLAVSLGGDSDTLAAITGSIAEAYYGVPKRLIRACKAKLPAVMNVFINRFEEIGK